MGEFMRKKPGFTSLVICVIIALLAIYMIIRAFINDRYDNIFVVGRDGTTNFSYELKNKRILMTGTTNEFETNKSKEELFSDLDKAFFVFKQSDDIIQFIAQNEVFTVKYLGKNHFILYDEIINVETKNGTFTVPFTTDQVTKKDYIRLDTKFYMECDFNYLKRFYGYYENVVVD